MKIKKVISILLPIVWAITAFADPISGQKNALPNIVLINADDLGYGDLSCYGATKVSTPNIDRLATEGRKFTDAHSASAVCTPSRYALLTGEYPHRAGIAGPIHIGRSALIIDVKQQTIASMLKDAGYATACIGKWHLGFGHKRRADWNAPLKPGPLELGFDTFFGVPIVNSHPPFVFVEDHNVVGFDPKDPFVWRKKANTRKFREKMGTNQIGGAKAAHELYNDEMVATVITEKAIDWIKTQTSSTRSGQASSGQASNPFFLYLATTNIHHPFTPHPRFKGTSEAGMYGDFIHELDWIVGEIMQTLKEQGVADNTLVIFTSDNGGMFNMGGQDAWDMGHRINGDLLGFKFGVWEGGHRVPFIAWWPGKIKANTVSDQLISNVDMFATFSAITGVTIKDGQAQDSINVLPALIDDPKQPVRDHLVLSPNKLSHIGIRKGPWMYIPKQGSGGFGGNKRGDHDFGGPAAITYAGYTNSDIENGSYKKDAPPAQLYNLEKDPQQTTNLYNQYPEVVSKLKALLESYDPPK